MAAYYHWSENRISTNKKKMILNIFMLKSKIPGGNPVKKNSFKIWDVLFLEKQNTDFFWIQNRIKHPPDILIQILTVSLRKGVPSELNSVS